MSTKTISVDLEAYERLRAVRLEAKESFSRVIKRGKWERPKKTCAALLEALKNSPACPSRPAHTMTDLDVSRASIRAGK